MKTLDTSDVTAIQQLLSLYGLVVDGDLGRLDEVMTHDATFDATDWGNGIHEGLPAIRAWFAQGRPPHPVVHHTTNVWIGIEQETVVARSKSLTITTDGAPRSGEYRDAIVSTPAGWRIASRVATRRYPQ